jgi:6-pyruvoyltetrahydropterin/6-carboxytetrahydropterin synthase
MTRLSRVYRFAASHRLHASELTSDQNASLYGKCNNPHGHGHNYTLHVGVRGSVKDDGRVVNPGLLDAYVQEQVLAALESSDLNADVAEFSVLVPTTENLAIVVDRRLRAAWPADFLPAQLDRIFIEETARNSFELRSA